MLLKHFAILFTNEMKRKACLPAQFHSPANVFHPDHALTHPLFLHLLKWQDVFVATFVKHGTAFLHLQVCKLVKQNTKESAYGLTNSDNVFRVNKPLQVE